MWRGGGFTRSHGGGINSFTSGVGGGYSVAHVGGEGRVSRLLDHGGLSRCTDRAGVVGYQPLHKRIVYILLFLPSTTGSTFGGERGCQLCRNLPRHTGIPLPCSQFIIGNPCNKHKTVVPSASCLSTNNIIIVMHDSNMSDHRPSQPCSAGNHVRCGQRIFTRSRRRASIAELSSWPVRALTSSI